ncbi:MAG: DUF1822 family protein [Okeania sp. SIO3I5]|uniref:DUF1822 family protein n=1 Tax=Okeania sp. SIO3I5 TaxID=2607805 RepID=UPI0013BB099E|nr:DUF1822 family protein [Okeania sp. SIO3I5]NEQ35307.1 DUF1822 family protein [Okeania sp. SIO3I5]
MSYKQFSEFSLEFENFSTGEISLKSENIEAALELVSNIKDSEQKWQTYIHALAFFACEEWLAERAPELSINKNDCSIFQPEYANLIPAVSNIKVGDFKVCLIVANLSEQVNIPNSIITLPEFTAHFYLVVEVEEESDLAAIRGFLPYNQLATQKSQEQSDNFSQISVSLFNSKLDELLLNLRCLEPTAIALPKASVNLSEMSKEKANTYLSDLLKLVSQKAVNVKYWWQNQTDVVANSLSWNLLPEPSLLRQKVVRNHGEKLEQILNQINHDNRMKIPTTMGRGYKQFNLAGNEVYLYAVTWLISESEKEWSLLLILSSAEGEKLPPGIKLRISDRTGILIEKEQNPNKENTYPYARIVGNLNEEFLVTIVAPNNQEKTSVVFKWNEIN